MNLDQSSNKSRTWFRPLLSVTLLVIIIIWIVRHGTLIQEISPALIWGSVTVSFFINLINAAILNTIVDAYRGKLTYANALHASALGSFVNAGGGLPIGTGLKFAILHRQGGLKIREIAAGLAFSTVIISFFLAVGMSASIWGTDFPFLIKIAPAALLVVSILLISLGWSWLRKKTYARFLLPLLAQGHFERLFLACLLMATAFLINYLIIGHFLFPEIPVMQMIFIACFGTLAGMISLLQSFAGISEISMGLATYLSGAKLIDGVQLALFMRFTSLVSSGFFLAFFYLLTGKGTNRSVGPSEK